MEIISAFVLLSVEPPSAWPQRASWLFDRDLRVFAWADGIGHLDHAHFAAETAKHLAEFEPDITAADGNQMRRQLLQIHDVAIGEPLFDRDQEWQEYVAAYRIDEDFVAD
jgi:hypothetical protein